MGRTSNNKDFSLFDVMITNRMLNSGGVVESRCYVGSMLIGRYLPNRKSESFDKATFYYPGIESWFRLKPITYDFGKAAHGEFVLSLEKSGLPEVKIASQSALIKFTTLTHNDNRKDPPFFSLENRVFVEVEPDEPKPLDWFVDFEWKFSNLLQFLFATPVRCDHLNLFWPSENSPKHPESCSYYANLAAPHIPNVPSSSRLLFEFESVGDHWKEIAIAYFDEADTLHNSLYLLSSDISNPPIGLENRFLALIQCLEGITRQDGDQTYIATAEYETVRQALASAIPSGTDKALRDKLKSMLKYGNEKSLRKRMKEITSTLDSKTQELVFKNQSEFIAGVVDTRNFWIHVLAEKTGTILENNDLYCACEKLQTLLLVLLAVRLKIPESVVRERLLQTSFMTQKRNIFLEGREK